MLQEQDSVTISSRDEVLSQTRYSCIGLVTTVADLAEQHRASEDDSGDDGDWYPNPYYVERDSGCV